MQYDLSIFLEAVVIGSQIYTKNVLKIIDFSRYYFFASKASSKQVFKIQTLFACVYLYTLSVQNFSIHNL